MSACDMDQQAQERLAGGGLFTYHLVEAFKQCGEGDRYVDLMQRVGNAMPREQSPQLWGQADLQVFSGRSGGGTSFISVQKVLAPDRVRVNKGTLEGLFPGAEIALYRPQAREAEKKYKIAEAVIEEGAEEYAATARLKGGWSPSQEELETARAWISVRCFGEKRVRVFFSEDFPKTEPYASIRKTVLKGDRLKLITQEVDTLADSNLVLWGTDRKSGASGVVSIERKNESAAAPEVLCADANSLDPRSIENAVAQEAIRLYLRRMALSSGALRVDLTPGEFGEWSDGPGQGEPNLSSFIPAGTNAQDRQSLRSAPAGQRERLLGRLKQASRDRRRRQDSGQDSPVDSLLRVNENEPTLMEVHNGSDDHLFVSVFNFGSDGGVYLVYPWEVDLKKGWDPIPPGSTLPLAVRFANQQADPSSRLVEEFMAIGTQQRIDWLYLLDSALQRRTSRSATEGDPKNTLTGPVGELMKGAIHPGSRTVTLTLRDPAETHYETSPILRVRLHKGSPKPGGQ